VREQSQAPKSVPGRELNCAGTCCLRRMSVQKAFIINSVSALVSARPDKRGVNRPFNCGLLSSPLFFLEAVGQCHSARPVGAGRGCGDGTSAMANRSPARWLMVGRSVFSNSTLPRRCLRRGHGPFRGRQAPHDDVRVGCLNVCSGVRTSHHQPIDRGHHDHRPSGTSPARRTRLGNFRICSCRLGVAPFEGRAVDPDAVKDDGDLAGNGDLRLLHTYPLCELHPPGLEGGPSFGPIK
jgi:hypothetical protein